MSLTAVVSEKIRRKSELIERSRAEFNYLCVKDRIKPGSKVLDVGAWNCYLGELLRDRLGCDVLSIDVLNANQTDMPFQLFDGRTIPAASSTFDVVLMLYVLHHAKDDTPLLSEAHRVLREQGRLIVGEDSVDGFWNRVLTHGFHIWLWLVTRMRQDGSFRTADEWNKSFPTAGFEIKEAIPLGHHLGRKLWPNNLLFVLEKALRGSKPEIGKPQAQTAALGASH